MATLSKQHIIDAVASKTGATKADAGRNIDALLEVFTDAVARGDEVKITGYLSISTAERAARTGRNPRTGETIQIKASKQPKFKAGAPLKDAVNS